MNLEKLWIVVAKLSNHHTRGLLTIQEYYEEMRELIVRLDCAITVLTK